ncbi:unnamed protein product [Rotaria magnacalcarata]|uniref:Uncharacterized protein n=1 Tax=Rotaria magnacalcarata TaxID=392030 RepID=A0A816X744_9BILA|nr:unnamed protein product [Rotaria magnacalcarata]CAF1583454.1 unnamed protein product [Rotaria magnacalcarata]CAF2040431.1 unnamed protein product [Rotaria magnacalcarata]CAF2090497.1 unnamed protein product [Rotaria magnacalcarata]CAF2143377.1 unnamed protein product [Rotaria magnacalcarata]
MTDNSSSIIDNLNWKVSDLCLCPYSEDENHPLTDLQIRIEEQQEPLSTIDEHDIIPPPPLPFPVLNPNDNNDALSSTLMS